MWRTRRSSIRTSSCGSKPQRRQDYKHNPDFNGHEQEGAGFFQFVIKDGERFGTGKAYLRPALDRPNLTLRTGVLVIRVLIEKGRAVGVEYLENGRLTSARASSEVVMAAGAIGSAQQLLLSGVGPADGIEGRRRDADA